MAPVAIRSILVTGFVAGLPTKTLVVRDIPEEFCDIGTSIHASSMFSGDTDHHLEDWFHTRLVTATNWDCWHPNTVPPEQERLPLISYLRMLETARDGGGEVFKLFDIQTRQTTNSRLDICREDYEKVITISGRADFIVSKAGATMTTCLAKAVCVIEVQSKDNVHHCELQLLTYLLLLMNTEGLKNLVGFLVYRDGLCRAYKATRSARDSNNVVYEENDVFHMSHIPVVLDRILSEI